jgi:hypothetical protein
MRGDQHPRGKRSKPTNVLISTAKTRSLSVGKNLYRNWCKDDFQKQKKTGDYKSRLFFSDHAWLDQSASQPYSQ